MPLINVALKGMDKALWTRVRIASLKRGLTMAVWLTEAIRHKLRRENG